MSPESKEAPKKRAFGTYHTEIVVAEIITPRNIHIRFQLPEGQEMAFKPGQFVQVFVPKEGDKPIRRSYSIASPSRFKSYFELCVTLVDGGAASTWLHHLKVGDRVTVMGPLGKFTLPETLPRDTVFIATGSGIAPFRSMIGDLLNRGTDRELYLLYGSRYDEDLNYQKEMEAYAAKHKNFHLFLTLSRPKEWKGPKGYVQTKIEEFVPAPKEKSFYICGLSNMINDVQAKLLEIGVPKEQIFFEKYD